MIIRMQGWAEGATPPTNIDTAASYSDVDVLTFEATEIMRTYRRLDGASNLDGTNRSWQRSWVRVKMNVGPRILSDSTARAAMLVLLKNSYFRFKDARHVLLGTANTVVFVKDSDFNPSREDATYLSWNGEITFITQAAI
jgi:hypothetical protein